MLKISQSVFLLNDTVLIRVTTSFYKEAMKMVFLMAIAVGLTTILGLIMFAETSEGLE